MTGAGVSPGAMQQQVLCNSAECCSAAQCPALLCPSLPSRYLSFFSASPRVRGKGRGFKNAETMEVMETEDGRGHTSDDELSTQ